VTIPQKEGRNMPEPTEKLCDERHIALKEILDLCIKKIEVRLSGMDIALNVSTKELERRLEELNNLRAEYTRDRATDRSLFVRQETYDVKTAGYDDWCRGIEKKINTIETRYATWAAALIALVVIIQLVTGFLK
jgi:hypothetical protein